MKKSVTSILRNNGKILVMKRSDKVWYHKGLWGGVSGHIEDNDKDIDGRAIIEIEEETGLKAEDIKFVRRGKPFVCVQDDIGTDFLVHPYLFESNTTKIMLDWEHTEYKWIAPEELKNLKHVPDLVRVLEAVGISVK